ncbi:hypothetical protein FBQ96_08985 [Nitrospirales bacterium NOB]|nr:MAG: LuxR family response regulator [Nitrospira sp. OLB3]MBV6468774.1 hypothetical protein [Nitrospirota bacterium]MCE7964107.1 hypothetical protein [Nitrospira sp. NTP2]MCK6493531.1 LuxR C-terminal-related transcriptional regulator [Nitrospira sp.]MDL1889697.1 hypothetical protein [Nitrospirales bacterium NOB]MEB2337043.1 LuxR C-terminal-related transcriptional regulator [Nitrospirales bacterium]
MVADKRGGRSSTGRRGTNSTAAAKRQGQEVEVRGTLSVRRRPEDLTPREREILQLIWGGHTNRSIAQHLSISIKTAEAHRSNMMKKLRVSNTAQLLKVALEGRILEAHDGKH